jgi:SAM-dependent methyltransferase
VSASVVVWHDLECGRYSADLPLWRALADREAGPILDVGAGTGRVALDLARHGHTVIALDRDPELLATLEERGDGAVATVLADAEGFDLAEARFGLILVPMQTIQLLSDRPAFLRAARRHLIEGGLLAAALAEALEGFDPQTSALPAPDVARHEGWVYASQPVAVRERPGRSTIERIRTTLAPDGARTAEPDAIDLAHVTAASLAREAAPFGFTAEPPGRIEATDEHVGSEVALLRA